MSIQKFGRWLRRIGIGLGSLSLALTFAGRLQAATSDTVALRCTVSVNLSVAMGTATYSFGTNLGTNQTALSTGAIPVTNNSAGLTEDLQINGSNTANWTAGVSTNTGTDTFNLRALISTDAATAPQYADFNAGTNTGLVSGAPVNLTNAAFGLFAGGDGNNVASGASRYLWFRMITPANISTGSGVEQSVTVTLTAAASSTY